MDKKEKIMIVSIIVKSVMEIPQLIFLILKWCGKIDWPWLWVLSPLWITPILVYSILIAMFSFERICSIKRADS